ncbi:hypothetical protein Malapachy_0956 [Malassezia pachydermatis]|uniref:Rab proteins geranylgeranyltransferase component n=1 Tax=Malassezia pachydermatis TaxID=77020 RepID=A0A0M9VQ39_9BASI|nr:hypothetical protein Malapachy_0956 [Malassezia pachydermatis]KOS14955.1 hypothetical protein Malapachy_0956 [Malassezia pachydermatis]
MHDDSNDTDHFDVLVLGTGVTEAVLSAALSRAGKKVLHVDPNMYYGSDWASLTLTELAQWAATQPHTTLTFPRYEGDERNDKGVPVSLQELDRHYALSVRPALLPAQGPMIEALIRSNVASYATFRLLGQTGVYTGDHLQRVPSSKSDIFRDKRISLADKRRLMRFLQSATQPSDALPSSEKRMHTLLHETMGLNKDLTSAVMYGVSLCWDADEPAAHAMERTRRILQGLGRYGDAALLVGQYGGAGELAQGFCRSSAVHGSVFVLGRPLTSLTSTSTWTLRLDDIPTTFTAECVAAPSTFATYGMSNVTLKAAYWNHVALLVSDAPIDWATHLPSIARRDDEEGEAPPDELETALLVFPPETMRTEHAVMVLVQGEGTFACPKGQYVYALTTYAQAGTSAMACLRPAVDRLYTLLTVQKPWLVSLYTSHPIYEQGDLSKATWIDTSAPWTRTPGLPRTSLCLDEVDVHTQPIPNLTESLDLCVEAAERAFWRIVGPSLEDEARAAAQARARLHDPAEYQGRGGVEPAMTAAPITAPLEFFAPQSQPQDEQV